MEKRRGVAFVSNKLRHLKVAAIQYSNESSSCVIACSKGTLYFIIEQCIMKLGGNLENFTNIASEHLYVLTNHFFLENLLFLNIYYFLSLCERSG